MPFIEKLKNYSSISTVGLEKNVGKTVTLNYILKRLNQLGTKVALTSIGIDGEISDQVTRTVKPEIEIFPGTIFVTSEKHYKMKRLTSEILDVSEKTTSLGKLVTARALTSGKILLSGPPNTGWIKEVIKDTLKQGAEIMIIDGALSRLSVGSPIITEGIILATGAAVSINMNEVVKKTRHLINLLNLPTVTNEERATLIDLEDGIYLIREEIIKLPIQSILHFTNLEKNIFKERCKIFITGVITDRFIDSLTRQENLENIEIIVKDFTKIFLSPEVLNRFIRKNGVLKTLLKTELIAVTVNPVAPTGYTLNSRELIEKLQEFIEVPVINVQEVEDDKL